MMVIMLYLWGTLLRGILIFTGAMLMERFGTSLLARGGRLYYYYLLLFMLVCPLPGFEYSAFSLPSAPPQSPRPVQIQNRKAVAVSPAASTQPHNMVTKKPLPTVKLAEKAAIPAPEANLSSTETGPSMPQLLFYLWVCGAGVISLLKLTGNIIWGRRLRKLKPVTDERILSIFNKLRKSGNGDGRAVRLLDSDPLKLGPCCTGTLKPCILLPVSLGRNVSDKQLEMLLAHELEHIRRHDMLLGNLRDLLKIPLFFNPFLHSVLKNLNCATELVCDDAVIRRLNSESARQSYGKLLLDLSTLPRAGMTLTAPGIRNGAGELKLRLNAIMSNSPFSQKRIVMLSTSVLLIGVACLFVPAYAAERTETDKNTTKAAIAPTAPHRVIKGDFTLTRTVNQVSYETIDGVRKKIVTHFPVTSYYQYLTSVGADGKPVPSASNIIFYSPWLGEKFPFKDKNNRYYAEKLGWTVFAIPDMGYTNAEMILAGQDELTKRLKLEPRKLLMYGASSGATNAINASMLFPDRFDAIAAHSSRRWYLLDGGFRKKDNVVRLLTNNWYDGAGNEAVRIMDDLRKLDMEGIRIQTPPNWRNIKSAFFHRGPHDFTQSLFHQYFKDIVELRDRNNGVIPPKADWPVKIKSPDGQSLFLPGKNLEAVYNKLPNALVGRNAGNAPLFLPAVSGKPAGTVLLVTDPDFKNPMKLLDTIYFLATVGNVDVYALEAVDSGKTYDLALDCLDKINSSQPVYVIGLGKGGPAAIFAALRSKNAGITKVTTLGTDREATLNGQSIVAEAGQKTGIPVIMYYDAATASEATNGPIIGVNVKVPAGFGVKITGILEKAVKPEKIAEVSLESPRIVNLLPQLTKEANALKTKVNPDIPETVRVYLELLKKIDAEAGKMQKAGIVDIAKAYDAQIESAEAEFKYADALNSGKNRVEQNKIKIEILKNLLTVYDKYLKLLYTRYNAGLLPNHNKSLELSNRYEEINQILTKLYSENQEIEGVGVL